MTPAIARATSTTTRPMLYHAAGERAASRTAPSRPKTLINLALRSRSWGFDRSCRRMPFPASQRAGLTASLLLGLAIPDGCRQSFRFASRDLLIIMVRPIEWCPRESHFVVLLVSWSVTIRILVSGKGLPFPIRGRLDPMSRPMFRSTAMLFLSCLGVALAPALARAQATVPGAALGNIANDPFTFYYAYYLPNQQIQAMRPSPMDTINQAVIDRQYYAQTQKQSLFNPISPYAEDYDPLRPYSRQQGN